MRKKIRLETTNCIVRNFAVNCSADWINYRLIPEFSQRFPKEVQRFSKRVVITDSLLRRIHKTYSRKFGTAVKVKDEQATQVCSFRTTESNPVNHNADHIARLYTVPTDIHHQLFQYGGLPRLFIKQVTTFQECAILIRQPAIEIMSYLSQADHTRPVNKYVLCILSKQKVPFVLYCNAEVQDCRIVLFFYV